MIKKTMVVEKANKDHQSQASNGKLPEPPQTINVRLKKCNNFKALINSS